VLRLGPDATEDQRGRNIEGLKAEAQPHGILVVRGDAEYQEIASKLDDAQFVEQRRLACQEICRVFRIPSHMLNAGSGGDSLTYSTVEQQSLDFVRYSLTPWLRRVELAISNDRDLAFQRQFVKFEVDGLLRADAATRSEVYTRALDPITGWLSRDEVRKLEDLPPEPGGPPQTAQVLNGMPIAAQNGASNGNR
jgi:HK97 family phage portal protein